MNLQRVSWVTKSKWFCLLTINFSNLSAASTAIDLHTTATGYSALGISNILIAVSVTLVLG